MVFNNFAELGEVFGIKSKEYSKAKEFRCRKCGGVMYHVPGTNVLVCNNEDEEGNVCGHNVLMARAF